MCSRDGHPGGGCLLFPSISWASLPSFHSTYPCWSPPSSTASHVSSFCFSSFSSNFKARSGVFQWGCLFMRIWEMQM